MPTVPQSLHAELADRLWSAQATGVPCAPLTDTHPALSIEDAYEIQSLNLARRMARVETAMGRPRPVGHKIGITSRAVQQWLNVAEPDFGGLLCDMAVPDGGVARISRLMQPRAEGELAFVLGRPLFGPGVTAAQVIAAIDFVLASIEIVDSRIADWRFRIQDTVADNASSGLFVLGSQPMLLRDVDTRLTGMAFRKNGEVVSTGAGAACLGNPINAVVWLVNKLGQHGVGLSAGEVILSGALGPVTPVVAGDICSVSIGRFPDVTVEFA